ncbi:calcium-binding protein [Planktothrix agardhii]|uniref:Uncharacterized protein n=1 Tax=Planktothrix agardhii (strain NIVA-CYA 126/8) TaxID=388467 RepID=A0A073CC95_PLAA1|nr:calcium-binding protein [Planktothrix agardhii]KEI65929.1 hypothetical protein A19Y_0766 [Planktothrix agardhii NIVA-CYA 126/8]CAD5921260.1 Bifunctional hemolysin/adenylate cyclase [Planktothrix agardhii]CAH2573141.1 Bifunctional hemolysin/adenylate cyclase [Planktothrix rubescens]
MVLIPNSALGVLVGDESSELISLIPGQLAGFPQGVLALGGNDTIQGSVDGEVINGNQGFDQIFGGGGNDTLFGGQDGDVIDGGVGDDILFGNLGADTITGGDGNDNLFGGKDNDNLSGGLGNDILSGDFGIDTLTGGGGSDIFVLGIGGGGADIITDFQDGVDLMQLPAGLTFSNILVQASGNQTAIVLATTGEELVRLNGIQPSVITSADFVGGSSPSTPSPTSLLVTASGQLSRVNVLTGELAVLANLNTILTDIAISPDGRIFGISFSSLYNIDSVTGDLSKIGDFVTDNGMNSLEFSSNGELYGSSNSSNSDLYKINLETGRASSISSGTNTNFISSGDLAFIPSRNHFFASSRSTDNSGDILYYLGLDGTSKEIGNIGFSNVWGLNFENGNLFGYTDKKQIIINMDTGAATFDKDIQVTGTIMGAS